MHYLHLPNRVKR